MSRTDPLGAVGVRPSVRAEGLTVAYRGGNLGLSAVPLALEEPTICGLIGMDALLGISFTGFLGVGVIMLVATPSNVHFAHVLFGELLGIDPGDFIQTLVAGAAALATVLVKRRDLILFCFDPDRARCPRAIRRSFTSIEPGTFARGRRRS